MNPHKAKLESKQRERERERDTILEIIGHFFLMVVVPYFHDTIRIDNPQSIHDHFNYN